MDRKRKSQQTDRLRLIFSISVVIGSISLLPVIHYKVEKYKSSIPSQKGEPDIISRGLNFPGNLNLHEVSVNSSYKSRLFMDNILLADIFIDERSVLLIQWKNNFGDEYFSDCSFYLLKDNTETAKRIFLGDVWTPPNPGLWTEFLIEADIDFKEYNYLAIIRNYDTKILSIAGVDYEINK